MVKICDLTYPADREEKYAAYYAAYPYELHDFQKWTVEAIVSRNHALICAPTGSGKTFGGDFALSFFHGQGNRPSGLDTSLGKSPNGVRQSIRRKTIYTCPIKALSNEKFYQFTRKYPDISFGLITGDIRCNPDADVLIMTTEILLNKLVSLQNKDIQIKTITNNNKSFEMDIPEELACVVFDEIHMIGDEGRGTVWENTLMMLPAHVQIVGLSATLAVPERFAAWIENLHKESHSSSSNNNLNEPNKQVYLAKKTVRAVPLTHYAFITSPAGIFKKIKDKTTQQEIRKQIDKPIILQDAQGRFQDANYSTIQKTLGQFNQARSNAKRSHVLNQVCKHMVEHEMFPALCYVFSRKKLEQCAHEVGTNLLEFDSKIPYTVDRECEQLLRERLPNFEEYLHLPEYVNLVALLRKGIAIHHAGLMPVLKEMVELLFARGYIKLLFCTETMSVGINLPVKTTIFTDVHKFSCDSSGNGAGRRQLHSFEMTQAAGRAGRLGIDTVGNVIHLNNLFPEVDAASYKKMLQGTPQKLKSKFRLSYSMVLQQILLNEKQEDKEDGKTNSLDLNAYASKSMVVADFQSELEACRTTLAKKQQEKAEQQIQSIEIDALNRYHHCFTTLPKSVNKQRKELTKEMDALHTKHGEAALKNGLHALKQRQKLDDEIEDASNEIKYMENYMRLEINKVLGLLEDCQFIGTKSATTPSLVKATIAQKIHEVPCLPWAELIVGLDAGSKPIRPYIDSTVKFTELNAKELVTMLSCFTSVRVSDNEADKQTHLPDEAIIGRNVRDVMECMQTLYKEFDEQESICYVDSGEEYTMHFDLMGLMEEWCKSETVAESKAVLQQVEQRGIFLGEFVKALLKINSVAAELETVAEYLGNLEWLASLREIPKLTLKFVVTNQSLYV